MSKTALDYRDQILSGIMAQLVESAAQVLARVDALTEENAILQRTLAERDRQIADLQTVNGPV